MSEVLKLSSIPIGFSKIEGVQGPQGPAGPTYRLDCNVETITRGLATPIEPKEIEIRAYVIDEDEKITPINFNDENYKLIIENGYVTTLENGEDKIVFSNVYEGMIGFDGERVVLKTTKVPASQETPLADEEEENPQPDYGYAFGEAYYDVYSIRFKLLKKGQNDFFTLLEASIPFRMNHELIELGQINEGEVVISDGKVRANSIYASAVTANAIAAGAISANKLAANRLESISPPPSFNSEDESGFTAEGSRIDFSNGGSIHFKTFYVKDDAAGFAGHVDAKSGSIQGFLSIGSGVNENFIDGREEADLLIKAGQNFSVKPNGEMAAYSGYIGGWGITKDSLVASNSNIGLVSGDSMPYTVDGKPHYIRFHVGQGTEDNPYTFVLTDQGHLYANKAKIEGEIKATSGNISNSFYVGNDSNGILLDGKNGAISSSKFANGVSGWKIDNNGNAYFNNAYVSGTLQAVVFEANTTSAVGGDIYVAPTVTVKKEYLLEAGKGANNKLVLKFNNKIDESEVVLESAKWKDAFVLLNFNSILNGKESNFDKLQGIVTSFIEEEGNEVFYLEIDTEEELIIVSDITMIKLGQSNSRQYIRLTANSGDVTPYMDVCDYENAEITPNPKVRLGNLSGINDAQFGGQLSGYGLYSNNAYLTGTLALPNAGITNQSKVGYNGGDTYIEADEDTAIRYWAGAGTPSSEGGAEVAPFVVTQDGSLYASKGIFKGKVIAESGIFSGSIRSAGIIVEKGGNGYQPTLSNNHFFVGYSVEKEENRTFDDYILDISSAGLRIWEGGLNVYSDFLSGYNPNGAVYKNYGYSADNKNPYPYIAAIDQGRLAVKDINIMSPTFTGTNIDKFSSIFSSNGALFFGVTSQEEGSFDEIENDLFDSSKAAGNIRVEKKQELIFGKKNNYLAVEDTGVNSAVGTEFVVKNNNGAAKVILNGGIAIEEVKDANGTSIGFNFTI